MKCHLLLFYATTNHFAIGLWCATKSGFYMTISEDQLSGWTKEKLQSTSQSKTCTKKVLVSGNLLSILSTTAFWILAKPWHLRMLRCNLSMYWYAQQINDMHRKLQCLRPALVNRKGPILHNKSQPHIAQPTLQNLNELGYRCHIHAATYFTQPDTSSSISTTFWGENASTSSRRQKMLSKSFSNPETWIFMLQKKKQTYFSLAKMC